MAEPFSPAERRYAGFWIRAGALLIDSVVVLVGFGAVALVVGAIAGRDVGIGVWYLLGIVGQWLYFALMESSERQATLGKSALGLAVTDADGRRVGFGRATGRYFAKILSGLPIGIGYLLAAFTARKQALHDMVAQTLVMRRG